MIKSIFSTLLLFICCTITHAQEVVKLYEGKAPGSENWTWTEAYLEKNVWNTPVVYNVAEPTLTVIKPEAGKANGTAAIICPGGGFFALSIESEGLGVARWLAAKGVTCFVLKYRLAETTSGSPMNEFMASMTDKAVQARQQAAIPLTIADGKAAIAYVRKRASMYGINPDKIGIVGFSAGGTVTAASLFGYTAENKPNFAAPIYAYYPAEMQGTVADDAPPLFVAAASNDQLNLQPHSVALYSKWNMAKKPAELHLYAVGGHGFGVKKQNLPSDSWIDRLGEWLEQQGFLKK